MKRVERIFLAIEARRSIRLEIEARGAEGERMSGGYAQAVKGVACVASLEAVTALERICAPSQNAGDIDPSKAYGYGLALEAVRDDVAASVGEVRREEVATQEASG